MWELDYKGSWAPKNWFFWTVALEKTLESPLDTKDIQSVNAKGSQSWLKDLCWSWNSNTLAAWWKELIHWKRPWCWERLKVGWEGDDRGWDGWMASPTQWTWIFEGSRSWWWTGKPGVLQHKPCCMLQGSQIIGYDWATELTDWLNLIFIAALFTIIKTWKQPRRPLTDEWVKKLQYTYMM